MKINWFSVWNASLPNSQYSFSLVQVASFVFSLVLAVLGNWEILFFSFSFRNKCPLSCSSKSVFSVLKNYSQDSHSGSSNVVALAECCVCSLPVLFYFFCSYFDFSFSFPSFLALSLPSRQRADNELQWMTLVSKEKLGQFQARAGCRCNKYRIIGSFQLEKTFETI